MKAVLLFSALLIASWAKMIDAIAVIVNNEPITTYEIAKVSSALHIPKSEALDLLIQKRLEEEQIKKLGIEVDEFELQEAIDKFAKEKGMDIFSLRQALESQGTSWEDYKKSFKEQLLRKKLYQKIATMTQAQPSEEMLKEYYENHKSEFTLAKRAHLIKYISPSKEILEKVKQNPLYEPENPVMLVKGSEDVELDKLNPAFASIINKTPQGSFTPILPLPNDNRYLLILVDSKQDYVTIPFEKAKGYILNKLASQNRSKSVKEYFDKLRASANIKVLRNP